MSLMALVVLISLGLLTLASSLLTPARQWWWATACGASWMAEVKWDPSLRCAGFSSFAVT